MGNESASSKSNPLPFGPAPSEEEAEEAISCLHGKHLVKRIICSSSFSGDLGDGSPSAKENGISGEARASSSTAVNVSENHPRTASSQLSQQISDAEVLRAFLSLGTSSFKALACSIARDTAVWGAVMKNEEVQKLKNSFNKGAQTLPLAEAAGAQTLLLAGAQTLLLKGGLPEETVQSILGLIWSTVMETLKTVNSLNWSTAAMETLMKLMTKIKVNSQIWITVKEILMKFTNKSVNLLFPSFGTQSSATPGSPGEGLDTFGSTVRSAIIACVGIWFIIVIKRILTVGIALYKIPIIP